MARIGKKRGLLCSCFSEHFAERASTDGAITGLVASVSGRSQKGCCTEIVALRAPASLVDCSFSSGLG